MDNTDLEQVFTNNLREDHTIKENTTNLIKFLRDLADSMERGDLSPSHKLRIGEFFMKYKFHEQADSDILNTEEFTHEEFMKFLTLGWYCYRVILNNQNLQ